ncbi:pentapeptide repeat-containing protein [Paenibacillus dendritiformis]|uniref:pentapeptide repeat-containing protein n=1 Tax=Paenibacillus dendritiformis TaxID=130049 RepID=UPI00105A73BE|nr:pentapeptide repeat-containing protein [Paenibacillus dendritiformis]TDL50260.1 pentapeptide repeat-containing protein [Paenibacillus dendritiformis]
MTRDEALRHWMDTAVAAKRWEQMHALHQIVMRDRERLAAEFTASFKQLCLHIRCMQDEKRKGKIKYIHYSALRSRLLSGDHRCRIDAYDRQWYADAADCSAEYDAGWAFGRLDEFTRAIAEQGKRYVGKVLPADVEAVMRSEAVWYTAYLVKLARHAVREAVRSDEFAAIDKEDELYIMVGEYKDRSELVYRYEVREKDGRELREMLSAGQRSEYVYEVFSGTDLSGMYFSLLNFSYANLSASTLAGNAIWGCAFIGADFRGANLEGVDMNRSIVHGASFKEANLRNASLEHIQGGLSFPVPEELHIPPFMETSFQDANLEHTSLRGADLRGADFRGAALREACFTDAELEGAIFAAEDVRQLGLSERQLAGIVIAEVCRA